MVQGCVNPLYYVNKKNTILIIDDEQKIIDILSIILSSSGYNVISDKNARLDFLETEQYPDLILLDNQLENKSGAEICRSLKTGVLTRHIPVIMISGTQGIGEIASNAAADDFLPKPFDMQLLLDKIDYLLHKNLMSYEC